MSQPGRFRRSTPLASDTAEDDSHRSFQDSWNVPTIKKDRLQQDIEFLRPADAGSGDPTQTLQMVCLSLLKVIWSECYSWPNPLLMNIVSFSRLQQIQADADTLDGGSCHPDPRW